jgi:nucleoside-diphosphate-sugar epimerase
VNFHRNSPVVPCLGDAESDVWIPLIETLDVIIEALGPTLGRTVFERATKAAAELRPEGAPLLSYVYTSGTWVHGDNRTDIVTDTTPITRPAQLVVWRPELEQLVVRSTAVNGIVVRPALVHGRSASILGPLFKSAAEGQIKWPGTPGGRYAVIHADDLADLFARVAEKASLLRGRIFDAANSHTEPVDELLQKLVKIAGVKGLYEYRKPESRARFHLDASGQVLTS